MEHRPQGGFLYFPQYPNGGASFPFPSSLRPPHPVHQQFYFPYPRFMAQPPAPSTTRASPSVSGSGIQGSANGWRHRVTIDVDAESRQRMYYTHEEDLRLVSAWLNNSTDPIEGNFKKSDHYWKEVVAAYKRTTPSDRIRDVKLLKSHWYKTTKKVSCFNGCFNQMKDADASGRSNDQLMERALELYLSRYKHYFTCLHWWRAVRDSPKWNAHISAKGQGIKRSSLELVVNKESQNVCPVGCKKAKNMKGVGSGAAATVVEEHFEKLASAQTEINAGISDMKEFQERLSAQKVEAANLAYIWHTWQLRKNVGLKCWIDFLRC